MGKPSAFRNHNHKARILQNEVNLQLAGRGIYAVRSPGAYGIFRDLCDLYWCHAWRGNKARRPKPAQALLPVKRWLPEQIG